MVCSMPFRGRVDGRGDGFLFRGPLSDETKPLWRIMTVVWSACDKALVFRYFLYLIISHGHASLCPILLCDVLRHTVAATRYR